MAAMIGNSMIFGWEQDIYEIPTAIFWGGDDTANDNRNKYAVPPNPVITSNNKTTKQQTNKTFWKKFKRNDQFLYRDG